MTTILLIILQVLCIKNIVWGISKGVGITCTLNQISIKWMLIK